MFVLNSSIDVKLYDYETMSNLNVDVYNGHDFYLMYLLFTVTIAKIIRNLFR